MIKTPKLTAQERDLIAIWYGQGLSIRQVAKRLNRFPSTVLREIKRNGFYDHLNQKNCYVAIHAQLVSRKRKSLAGKRPALKNQEIFAYVTERLRRGWSPEQIAGRLKKKSGRTVVCHETIYRFIYDQKNQEKRFWEYLPWKRQKRKRKLGRSVRRERIPYRVSIHLRPEEINQRLVFGHWEGDTIEGRKINRGGLHTEVERLSRFVAGKKVVDFSSQETCQKQEEIFSDYPSYARKSTTLDNGRENHHHYQLKRIGLQTYFADPYSAWQRGTNEYHNGLLRRYFPKGTDFSQVFQEEIDDILEELNNRPRKVLNYNTPKEVFNTCLEKESGVAIQL